jgi:hypothetical protein
MTQEYKIIRANQNTRLITLLVLGFIIVIALYFMDIKELEIKQSWQNQPMSCQ